MIDLKLSPGSDFGPILQATMSRKRLYRCDLFSPEKLTSTYTPGHALQELQSIFTKDDFKRVSQELFNDESPDTPLLVLSCKSTSSSYLMICQTATS